jgi:uncharacterized repeat protein (TIGR01451 family)
MLLHISPAIAATAAGTQIKNLATVTYEDTNGNKYSAQSNEAIITVKQVYSAEMGSDTTKLAAAGQVVYVQNTLTNTGNGEDKYTLAAIDDNSLAGDNIDASSIKVYLDSNGNGLADAGEKELSATDTITLLAGQSASIVMAVAVPNTATAGDKLGAKLTATPTSGTVTDISASKGTDGLDATNQTLITVSNDAILNFTKSAVIDSVNNQITYTLSVTNTGNQTAADVKFFDAFPTGTTFVTGSATASGLLVANNDALPISTTLDETNASVAVDVNRDGDKTDTALAGIYALDKALAPGQTASITFKVAYDPATFNNDSIPGSAGDVIKNTAVVTGDTDGNPTTPAQESPSNSTQTTLPQAFKVASSDTGDNAADSLNDGKDDDTANDVQLVQSAPAGSVVLFDVKVSNTGTGRDTFELSMAGSSFPPGTVFTYWNKDGTVQLVDTNSKGGVDTGMLEAGASTTIMVKAQLPADATTGGTATFTATSANDPSATPQKDTTVLQLAAVTAPGVDVYDDKAKSGSSVNEDTLGTAPYNINKLGQNPGTRAALTGVVGGKVEIPLYIDNGSGSSDSFQLTAGSSLVAGTVGALPAGWSVLFYKGDGAGHATGSPITSTALLPAMSNGHEYIAVVSIPTDPAYALADYVADNDGDGTKDTMLANADTDGDQPIFIQIKSANSNASDIMLDAIDVTPLAQVTLTPPGSNQIQPGGSVDYTNSLDNTGNTTETVELTATNSKSGDSWNNTVKVPVDTDGDNKPDVFKTLAELAPGDVIIGIDPNGNPARIEVTDANSDNNPEVTLEPGEKFDLTATTFAPSDAAPGATDVLTISATNVKADSPSTSVDNASTVILGQVRLEKSVAYDAACDGTPDGAAGQEFAANLTAQVAPKECAIWQIKVENQGDADALNVIVRDKVPAFSTFVAGSMKYCIDSNCTPAPVTDTLDTDAGKFVDPDITFYAGSTPAPATDKGGKLLPGQQATVRFSTKVN